MTQDNHNSKVWRRCLQQLLDKQEIVCLYLQGSRKGDDFELGVIVGFSEEWIGFASFDSVGRYTGMWLVAQAEVFRFEWGGQYERARLQLVRESMPTDIPEAYRGEPSLMGVLEFLRDSKILCEIGIGEDFKGRIEEFDDSAVLMEFYSNGLASSDGQNLFRLDDITKVEFGSRWLRRHQEMLDADDQIEA